MKYFGEFLVKKGIIDELTLVKALLEQMRAMPSIAEIAFEAKLLDANVLLSVFKLQSEQGLDFKQACMQLSLWKESFQSPIKEAMTLKRIPLGQILIREGYTDLEEMTKALDEFLSEIDKPDEKLKPSVCEVKADPVLLEAFLQELTVEKLSQMKSKIDSFAMSSETKDNLSWIKEAFVDIHYIRGLMRSIRADQFEAWIELLEKCFSKTIERIEQNRQIDLKPLLRVCGDALLMIQEFRELLMAGSSESAWFSSDVKREAFEGLKRDMSELAGGGVK